MEYKIHTTFPEFLLDEWNNLVAGSASNVPFLRYEYLEIWWRTRGGGEWPQADLTIITAHEDGRLVGVAPLFHTPDYKGRPALMLVGSIEITDYLDLIALPEDMPRFIHELLPFLNSGALPEWKALDWQNILDDSPTLPILAQEAARLGWTHEQSFLQNSPFVVLPGEWESYLARIDKKQRHEIRRKMRRIEEFGVPIHWYITSDPARLDEDIEAFMALMAQDPRKDAFLTPAMREHMRLTARCAFENDCLRLAFLEIDGKKAAVYFAFDYLNRIWLYNSGIDWMYNEFSPGWVLLGYLLKWANEQKYEVFDFLRGDENYKYRFGATDRTIVRVAIERP